MAAMIVDNVVLGNHPLPQVGAEANKNDRGEVLVIAGGADVPGAPILTGLAALRVGAGKLALAAPGALAGPLGIAVPEAKIIRVGDMHTDEFYNTLESLSDAAEKAAALVIGPGMADKWLAREWALTLQQVMPSPAIVIDAAALTGLDPTHDKMAANARAVVTPHHGELASLFDVDIEAIDAEPETWAARAAECLDAVAVVKGAETFIAEPGARIWRHQVAAPGLGTSGSGDLLAGVIGGLLARGADGATAALWGVAIHARAGVRLGARLGLIGYLARDVSDELTVSLQDLQDETGTRPGARL